MPFVLRGHEISFLSGHQFAQNERSLTARRKIWQCRSFCAVTKFHF
jgi:hypothetical protein